MPLAVDEIDILRTGTVDVGVVEVRHWGIFKATHPLWRVGPVAKQLIDREICVACR